MKYMWKKIICQRRHCPSRCFMVHIINGQFGIHRQTEVINQLNSTIAAEALSDY